MLKKLLSFNDSEPVHAYLFHPLLKGVLYLASRHMTRSPVALGMIDWGNKSLL